MAETEKKKSAPTEKMVAAAKAAATRHGVKLPPNLETDFDACKEFLDKYLNKPTEKAVNFAKKIAADKGLTVPDDVVASGKDLSAWIDANKG